MEWPLVKSLLWALVLSVQIHGHRGCIEEERIGLLELKAFMISNSNYTNHLLLSWVNGTKSECCNWEGVRCSTTTNHVIKLSLYSNFNRDIYFQRYNATWFLNVSLLHPFKELMSLDFSLNTIGGWLGNEESNCLSKLNKLTHLNLSWTHFDKENLRFLGALPVLKSLDLSYANVEGPLSGKELVNLSNLEVFILKYNRLNGSLPFKDMVNFSSLEILDLSFNLFTGSISPYIGALSSLKAISLSQNQLYGTSSTQDLCALKKLEELDLAENFFEGTLLPCLNNLTSLKLFDISENWFSGNMSSSPIASMTSLEYVDLSGNHFEGLFSFNLIANHSKLKVIQIICYDNKFEIETEFPSGQPLFQLKALVLSNLNKFTGNIPKFLFDQHELEVIDISHSMLKGSFSTWLLENNTRLQRLNLRGNSFVGQFHLPPYHNKDLLWLDVSENHLHGQLQENLGKLIPKIECLYLSRNLFEGNFPSSIGDMSNLKKLDLSFNNFSGEVPTKLIANHTWDILRLSNNNFHGEIFSKHFNLSIQYCLELNNNHFTGTVPLISSMVVDISNNHMSGIIPKWIGNSTLNRLPSFLSMNDNLFKGQVPCELGQYNVIDLSHNLLSRSLPSCLNVQNAGHILLQGNKLTGTLPKAVFNSSSLMTLDIRDNSFFGSIPDEIDGLSNLRVLLLSGNHFSGMIPRQLCRLEKIGLMDLSKNFFSGTIPYFFYNITFGKLGSFDLAYFNSFPNLVSDFHIAKFNHLRISDFIVRELNLEFGEQVGIDFVTKYRSSFYKGFILDIMFGLDLSFNKLTGEIPPELGQLFSILALNLSYNQLTGPIHKIFSNLTQLESLDLSHNNLSGEIPTTLIDLTSLEVFNVAHNNLSGKLLDIKAQFATFEKSSYEGNPFLCGPPLEKSCSEVNESPPSPQNSSKASDRKWYEVDLPVFSTSFLVSFIVFFLGVVSILYINPHWRQQCFNLVEDHMFWCHYFASKTLKRLSNRMFH